MNLFMTQKMVVLFSFGTSIKTNCSKFPVHEVVGDKNAKAPIPRLRLWKTALAGYVITAAEFGHTAHLQPRLYLFLRPQTPAQPVRTGGGSPGCFGEVLKNHFETAFRIRIQDRKSTRLNSSHQI